jgi:hypothetical protein
MLESDDRVQKRRENQIRVRIISKISRFNVFPLFCEYFYRFGSSFFLGFISPSLLCFIIIIIIRRTRRRWLSLHTAKKNADFTTCQTMMSDKIILHCHVCVQQKFFKNISPSCLFTARLNVSHWNDVPVMRSSHPRSVAEFIVGEIRERERERLRRAIQHYFADLCAVV